MSEIENAYIQQEQEILNRLEDLLKTKRSLDDMEIQRDMYKRLFYTYLNEVVALKEKLSAIQAITNPDQTQE